jgi:predicted Zn-dependent protease
MRSFLRTLLLSAGAMLAVPGWCAEDIGTVLMRSQLMQLEALRPGEIDAADPRVQLIATSLERVLTIVQTPPDVQLIVVEGSPLVAVCLMGRVIVANAVLANLSEAERTFVLAHEVGHIAYNHWGQLGELYRTHIPGEVVQERTDAVAGILGREASALSHRHEFEADAFALRLLKRLGDPDDTPIVLFQQHLPLVKGTATHPGTYQRISQLQELR